MTKDNSTKTYRIGSPTFNVLSRTAVPIEMLFDNHLVGLATAFYERFDDDAYLVTNWHNITGRDPATGQPRASDCVVPNQLRAKLHGPYVNTGGGQTATSILPLATFSLPIECGRASSWIMHPSGQDIDVAAIRLPRDSRVIYHCMRDTVSFFDPAIQVGSEVYILGFPRGLQPTGIFPIWKKGSIATEPGISPYGEPCIWVDAATREGMSGSPVLVRAHPVDTERRLATKGYNGPDVVIIAEPGLAFIGIYSGRMGVSDALEAQIGKVWRPDVIQQMLENPRPLDFDIRPRPPLGNATVVVNKEVR